MTSKVSTKVRLQRSMLKMEQSGRVWTAIISDYIDTGGTEMKHLEYQGN